MFFLLHKYSKEENAKYETFLSLFIAWLQSIFRPISWIYPFFEFINYLCHPSGFRIVTKFLNLFWERDGTVGALSWIKWWLFPKIVIIFQISRQSVAGVSIIFKNWIETPGRLNNSIIRCFAPYLSPFLFSVGTNYVIGHCRLFVSSRPKQFSISIYLQKWLDELKSCPMWYTPIMNCIVGWMYVELWYL